MSFSGALTTLDTHLVAAGAAVSPAITDVAQGERTTGNSRIDYWFTEIGDPVRMGGAETLSDRMYGVTVLIRPHIAVSDRRETRNANVEARLYALSIDIVSRVMGDYTLGGNCAAGAWSGVSAGWTDNGGSMTRSADITFVFDFVEAITIAP